MIVKAVVGDAIVDASGSLILDEDVTKWTLQIEDLTYNFSFELEGGLTEPVLSLEERSLNVALSKNYHSTFWSYAMNGAGVVDGRTISIALWVKTIGDEKSFSRIVTYTVYSSDGGAQ